MSKHRQEKGKSVPVCAVERFVYIDRKIVAEHKQHLRPYIPAIVQPAVQI